jgi:hypothetical protein
MSGSGIKVLHLIGGDLAGGAARGAYGLHQGLINIGVDSKIITNSKITLGDPTVKSINTTKMQRVVNILMSQLDQFPTSIYKKKEETIFSTGFFGTDKEKDKG